MKKIAFTFLFANCLLLTAYSQVVILKTTSQKLFAGIGGGSITYSIQLKNKIEVDSVKSIADGTLMQHYINENKNGAYEISFGQGLGKPHICGTCPDMTPKPINLTKGVKVYYKNKGKRSKFKVKKFEELPTIMAP